MENNNKRPAPIDMGKIFKTLWKKKKYFFIILPIVFILSSVYIFSKPRSYKTEMKLAPELNNNKSLNGSLGSLASSFGFDLDKLQANDAITPLLYPELMEDNGFVYSLWNVPVADKADTLHTTYYDYLAKYQKCAWWEPTTNAIKQFFSKEEENASASGKSGTASFNPYKLTKKQNDVTDAIKDKITISFDKKTYVITVSVTDQDPLICKTVADTVAQKLQRFITDYRTSKARIDVAHYQKLSDKAKAEYEEIRNEYVRFADANTDLILESVKAKLEDMENEMQLRYNTYTTIQAQLQAAKAKVQEQTPAFTIIKGAEVPIKPAKPKRMFFIIAMMILATFVVSGWILIKYNGSSAVEAKPLTNDEQNDA